MKKQTSGFSLTELLVTLVIMGTLIGIAVPTYRGMTASGAARTHQKNFDEAVAFVAAQCRLADLNPAGLVDIYVELNGGPVGKETKYVPGGGAPAFVFGSTTPAAGQVAINGLPASYLCVSGTSPVTVRSGPVATGAAAGDYPSGDPDGFTTTVQ